MQVDAMVDTDSSSDKEICKVDKHKLTIRKEEEVDNKVRTNVWMKVEISGQVYIFHPCPEKEAETEEDHLIMMKCTSTPSSSTLR